MKRKFFLMGTLALIIASGIFWSCQKEELINPEEVILKKGKITAMELESPLSWTEVCAGEDLVLTLIGSGNKQVQYLIEGDWINQGNVSQGDDPVIVTIANIPAGTHYFRYKVGSGGFTDAEPIVIEYCGCENLLEVELDCGEGDESHILKISFIAGEAGNYVLQGGLNAKVEGDVISMVADGKGEFNQTHPGVVNSTANVIRWEGDLDACEEIEITVEFSGKCAIGEWTAK